LAELLGFKKNTLLHVFIYVFTYLFGHLGGYPWIRVTFVLESHYEYYVIIKMGHGQYSISFRIHKKKDSW